MTDDVKPRRRRRRVAQPDGPTAVVQLRSGRKSCVRHRGYVSYHVSNGMVSLKLYPSGEILYPVDVVESITISTPFQMMAPPQQPRQYPGTTIGSVYSYRPPEPSPMPQEPARSYSAREVIAQQGLKAGTTSTGAPQSEVLDENGIPTVVSAGFLS